MNIALCKCGKTIHKINGDANGITRWIHLRKSWLDIFHAAAPKNQDGAALIAAERQRQIEAEGWTLKHDDEHEMGELIGAARTYLQFAWSQVSDNIAPPEADGYGEWPWLMEWWKPSPDPKRNLAKAGALIAAEIDRLNRIEERGR